VDLSWNSTGYETVHERVVFSLLGLAFERKQIPRLVGNVSSSGDTFRFARHPGPIRNDSVSLCGSFRYANLPVRI